MPGYANRTIRLEFPDLSEPDDLIYVVMRNPTTLPMDALIPKEMLEADPDGTTTAAAKRDPLALWRTYAPLITDWHVYDGQDESDTAEPLPLPATAEQVASLPLLIQREIMDRVNKVLTPPQ